MHVGARVLAEASKEDFYCDDQHVGVHRLAARPTRLATIFKARSHLPFEPPLNAADSSLLSTFRIRCARRSCFFVLF